MILKPLLPSPAHIVELAESTQHLGRRLGITPGCWSICPAIEQ